MPLPSTPLSAPQLPLHELAQLGFVDAFLALPGPVEAAVIAGAISLPLGLATLIISLKSLGVAKQAKEVAQDKLFADLLKVRMEWHEGFKEAVAEREKELKGDFAAIASSDDSAATRTIKDRQHEAHWFFDNTVTTIVNAIAAEFELQKVMTIESEQLSNSRNAIAKRKGETHAFNVRQLMIDLSRALKPFLFVGHVKQTRQEAKATPRISGLFRY